MGDDAFTQPLATLHTVVTPCTHVVDFKQSVLLTVAVDELDSANECVPALGDRDLETLAADVFVNVLSSDGLLDAVTVSTICDRVDESDAIEVLRTCVHVLLSDNVPHDIVLEAVAIDNDNSGVSETDVVVEPVLSAEAVCDAR